MYENLILPFSFNKIIGNQVEINDKFYNNLPLNYITKVKIF